MSIYLNASEIFQVGIEIERNGKLFYEAAANQAREEAARVLGGIVPDAIVEKPFTSEAIRAVAHAAIHQTEKNPDSDIKGE